MHFPWSFHHFPRLFAWAVTTTALLVPVVVTSAPAGAVADTVTQTPTMSAPVAGTRYASVPIAYTLPESPTPGSVSVFVDGALLDCTLTMGDDQSVSTTVSPASPVASPVTASSCPSIPNGTYAVSVRYRDSIGNAQASSTPVTIVVDTVTQSPTLTTGSGSRMNDTWFMQYTLPEAGSAGTLTISGQSKTCTLTLGTSALTAATHRFNVNLAAGTSESNKISSQSSDCASLPEGTYGLVLSYQDAVGNSAATASSSNITLDRTTAAPTLTSPASSSAHSTGLRVAYTLPETPMAGRVVLTLAGTTYTYTFTFANTTTMDTTLSLSKPWENLNLQAIAPNFTAIVDGTYSATLSYRDDVGNPAATTEATEVVIDTATRTPTLTSPATGALVGPSMTLDYDLPETPRSGTVEVSLVGATTCTLTMSDAQEVSTVVSLDDPTSADEVTAASDGCSSIPSGTYTVTLGYEDALGNTGASTSSTSVTVARVPTAPAAPTVTVGVSSVAVNWTVPSDGGSAITGYVATATPSGATCETTGTSCTITALAPGVPVTVTVRATNAIGAGPASDPSGAVTPFALPGAPGRPSMTPGNRRLTVTWTTAAANGAPVTDYVIRFRPASSAVWSTVGDGVSSARTVTLTGLSNGTGYVVQVAAVNAAGTGPWSTTSAPAMPRTVPGTPAAPSARTVSGRILVSWTAPSTGGSAITAYEVQVQVDGGRWRARATVADGTSVRLQQDPGTYRFRVCAQNAAGVSEWSAASVVVRVRG